MERILKSDGKAVLTELYETFAPSFSTKNVASGLAIQYQPRKKERRSLLVVGDNDKMRFCATDLLDKAWCGLMPSGRGGKPIKAIEFDYPTGAWQNKDGFVIVLNSGGGRFWLACVNDEPSRTNRYHSGLNTLNGLDPRPEEPQSQDLHDKHVLAVLISACIGLTHVRKHNDVMMTSHYESLVGLLQNEYAEDIGTITRQTEKFLKERNAEDASNEFVLSSHRQKEAMAIA